MDILRKIQEWARQYPDRTAIRCGTQSLTYGELWSYSGRLASWLLQHAGQDQAPVAVYGHKHPWMLVCFLACVRSGHAYCPIDISVPDTRTSAILQLLPSQIVLTTEQLGADTGTKQVIGFDLLEQIIKDGSASTEDDAQGWVKGEETYYIIFTSGSTGTPKGVQITADCLNHYLDWSVTLGSDPQRKQGQVFLNQAPFSFDLSVMDLYTSLASGGTLYCLEKSVQSEYRTLIESLRGSQANVWVSTPSFAEVCLSEKLFSGELLPGLEVFLFCGETLTCKTARRLQQRFPNARIMNTYGPTESTVAVTEVLVTPELAGREAPLPVGRPRQGTQIEIWDAAGEKLPEGEKGEIILIGDTVSTGYFGREDLTEKAFFCRDGVRGYHTGDEGYLKDGMLYYCGRIDLQIKLHGYRIELEDIENNIARLPQVKQAVVIPNSRGGKVTSLTAYVVKDIDARASAADMRAALQQFLPDYMVPKKIIFLDQMPMTNNGKANRKMLAESVCRAACMTVSKEETGGKHG